MQGTKDFVRHSSPAAASLPEADLRLVIDAIPALVVCALPDGTVEFANKRWQEYTGRSLKELKGSAWQSVIHPDDLARFIEQWTAARAAGEPFESEARVRRNDREYRWFSIRKAPLRDDHGQIVRWYGAGHDIEERKQAEERVRRDELELRTIIETIPAFVGTARPDGAVDFISQSWLDHTGMSREQWLGEGWMGVTHPDDLARTLGAWQASQASGAPVEQEARYRLADGGYRWFLSRNVPLRDEKGKVVKWYGTLHDIDDQKRMFDELRRSETYLAEAQRLSHTGSFGWSVPTGKIEWSDETFRIFEYDRAVTPTLQLVLERVHPDDRVRLQQVMDHASADGADFETEFRIQMPDGRIKQLHLLAQSSKDSSGEHEFVGAVTDVTVARQSEEALRGQELELRQILNLAPQYVAVVEPGGSRLYLNQAGLDYLGCTLDEWRNGDGRRFVHPDDRPVTDKAYEPSGESPYEGEGRVRRHDGIYRWLLFRNNPLRDEHGHVRRWYVSATDIDDRKRAQERLEHENIALREEIDKGSMLEAIVGTSLAIRGVLARVAKVAPTDSTVLVTGETGTGKELIARAIHKGSPRSRMAFVSVNCAAIPQELIGSELFGHEKGAFTGALQRRLGRFELAEGGSIFLDEIGDLPPETQVALLRVLQERELQRVGGSQSIPINVRVIAATNRDLQAAIDTRAFRSDLFYRLNVFPIDIPALRERREDIPLLIEYFIGRCARKAGKLIRRIDKASLELLQMYSWPGNIRELQNVIERSVIVCDTDVFSVDPSWLSRREPAPSQLVGRTLSKRSAKQEKEVIEAALVEARGRVSGQAGAAAKLGIPSTTLESKIKSLGIDKHRFKSL